MVKCVWEKWNAKVRNHNLRGSENEMNRKVLNFVRPEEFQFLEKGQNRNFGYKIVISVKNTEFIL